MGLPVIRLAFLVVLAGCASNTSHTSGVVVASTPAVESTVPSDSSPLMCEVDRFAGCVATTMELSFGVIEGPTTRRSYDGEGLLVVELDRYGQDHFTTYDPDGRPLLVEVLHTNGTASISEYTWEGDQLAKVQFDHYGDGTWDVVTSYTYREGLLIDQLETSELSYERIRYTYDEAGVLLSSVTDRAGRAESRSTYVFDSAGNMVRVSSELTGETYDGDPYSGPLVTEEWFFYDECHRLTSHTEHTIPYFQPNPSSRRQTDFTYGTGNRLVSERRTNGPEGMVLELKETSWGCP